MNFLMSCGECPMHDTDHCDDCIVTFLVEDDRGNAMVFDAAEERAVRMLARAGLVPVHRDARRRSCA